MLMNTILSELHLVGLLYIIEPDMSPKRRLLQTINVNNNPIKRNSVIVGQCQLSVSVNCRSVSTVGQCQLSVSVNCRTVSTVCQCQLSVSVNCRSVSTVRQCQLSVSVNCRSVSTVGQCQLSVSVNCRSHQSRQTCCHLHLISQ